LKFLLLFLLALNLIADNDYSLRLAAGSSSASDFDKLYTFQGLNKSPYNTSVYGVEGGYRILKDMNGWPFDLYVKGGLNYMNENGYQPDFLEATLYVKVYYKLEALDNEFRVGLAEGISMASRIPYTEKMEAEVEKDNTSNLLNYMELTFDFDMGKLVNVNALKETYFGYMIKHRSGMYGLYGGVKDGGSNYNCLYIEKSF
jgi:outer membrane protein